MKSFATHSKRSPEFCKHIDVLIHSLNMMLGPGSTLAEAVTKVLLNNTTDVPCIVKAEGNEPVFVLRAQDQFSDKLVDEWCELMIAQTPVLEPLSSKVHDAREAAEAMRHWPTRKVPD